MKAKLNDKPRSETIEANPLPDIGVTATIEWLTVPMAKEFLEANTMNRPEKRTHAMIMAREIEAGRFLFNGETIKIADDGTLLDGQNRCRAVLLAGKPILTLIVRGLAKSSFHSIDIGSTRTGGDILHISGEEKYPNILAGALNIIRNWEMGALEQTFSPQNRIAKTELLDVLNRNPGIRESASRASRKDLRRTAGPSILAFCHYVFSSISDDWTEWFFDRLQDGAGLSEKDSLLHLRNKLLTRPSGHGRMLPLHVSALIIKAWNLTVTRKPSSLCRWSEKESFPEIETRVREGLPGGIDRISDPNLIQYDSEGDEVEPQVIAGAELRA